MSKDLKDLDDTERTRRNRIMSSSRQHAFTSNLRNLYPLGYEAVYKQKNQRCYLIRKNPNLKDVIKNVLVK